MYRENWNLLWEEVCWICLIWASHHRSSHADRSVWETYLGPNRFSNPVRTRCHRKCSNWLNRTFYYKNRNKLKKKPKARKGKIFTVVFSWLLFMSLFCLSLSILFFCSFSNKLYCSFKRSVPIFRSPKHFEIQKLTMSIRRFFFLNCLL